MLLETANSNAPAGIVFKQGNTTGELPSSARICRVWRAFSIQVSL